MGSFASLYAFKQCVACAGAGIRDHGQGEPDTTRATPDRRGTSNVATAAGFMAHRVLNRRTGGDEEIRRPDWVAHFEDETQQVVRILGLAFAFACVAEAGLAQTQPANATPPAGGEGPSTAAMAQEATNPFAASWLMQIQQNNNWVEMPFGEEAACRAICSFSRC